MSEPTTTDTATLRADLAAMERRAQEAEQRAKAAEERLTVATKLWGAWKRRCDEAESKLALLNSPALLEALAAWEHDERWSDFDQATWADLPDAQRESDREEVRHYLAVIREFMERESSSG